MDRPLNCDEIRDLIDGSDGVPSNPSIEAHLASCPDCLSYGRVSQALLKAGEDSESVSLWNRYGAEYAREKPRSVFSYQMAGLVALGAVAVVLTVGLFLGRNPKPLVAQTNMVASNTVVATPVSSYDYESSDLDYYYEISMKY